MSTNGHMLETLIHSELFQSYERAYSEITGMPVTLRAVGSEQLPFRGKQKENSWCALIGASSSACTACSRLQDRLDQGALNEPVTLTCTYGLCETVVPVKLGTQTIGFLQTGQVMQQRPNESSFRRAVKKAKELGADINNSEARKAYFATPVISQKKLDSVTGLLNVFADYLSIKSNQIAMQTVTAEPPVVARAKQFIQEHYAEELSLGQVAAAAHSSIFYFCKLFRKTTGTTFTEYVSRTRVEQAKRLLLNHNLRISEIAFKVGFQSLTHFNRVFKHITGESPTVYRVGLPKSVPSAAPPAGSP